MRRRPLSDINVTPLVDVMLVLLIIFMITAPMLKEGIVMDLPRVKSTAMRLKENPVIISIKSEKRIYVGKRRVSFKKLEGVLKQIILVKGRVPFVIEANRKVPFEVVVKVIAALRRLGITKVGISTTSEKRR